MADKLEHTVLIEASWEVAHKDGGIHTVLTTKMQHARAHFSGRYIPVGAYRKPIQEFLEMEIPEEWRGIATNLEKLHIGFHYGAWEIPGKPETILLDWEGLFSQAPAIKESLWKDFKLDTLTAGHDTDEPLLWSVAVGHFAAEYAAVHQKTPILLHVHEWLAAGAILAAKQQKAPVHTVFTTHATVLGRALCSQDIFIYDKLSSFKPDEEAARCNVVSKHQLERLGATEADVFTTVSSVTAKEASAFLGRTPEVVENGIDANLFPDYDQLAMKRTSIRRQLDDFVSAYFFPSYRFNLAQTRYFFAMGRYEFRNKGYDLELAALGRLNSQLKKQGGDASVVAFFFVPGDSLRLRPEVTKQMVAYKHLATILKEFSNGEGRRVEREIWDDVECSCTLMPDAARETARRLLDQIRSKENPPVSPFELRDPEHDAILTGAHSYGLNNDQEDRVKVLFFPVYVDGFDGALNLPLYDVVSACDLGLFTSLYEPWGYTPVESLALGVPAITSTLAGFGQAVKENPGVMIVDRDHGKEEKELKELVDFMENTLKDTPRTTVERRLAAYQTVADFDWARLYPKYLSAYEKAFK
jgi:glycosyltransferase involved in cell wall biosynthesis